MMILYLAGFLIRRRSDPLNSLGFAVIVVLLINPFMSINVGFLMSVVSTFSIIVFALPISDGISGKITAKVKDGRFAQILSSVVTCVLISFFAQLSTIPIQIGTFGGLSLVGVITNLLFLPVVMPLLVSTGLFCVMGYIPVIGDLIRYAAIYLVGYCVNIVEKAADFKFSFVSISSEVAPFAAVCVIAILIGLNFLLQKRKTMLTKKRI